MSDRIILHKEYGLNPAVTICPFCGKDTGIAILGHNNGAKAPRKIVDLAPCDECQKKFNEEKLVGIIALDKTSNQVLGSAMVLEEAFSLIVNTPIPPGRVVLAEPEAWDKIIKIFEQSLQGKDEA